MYLAHIMRRAFGGRKTQQEKFEPLRDYPGSPFTPKTTVSLFAPGAALGGYQKMSRGEAVAWLRSRGINPRG